jgi:site-specific DNA recombinase
MNDPRVAALVVAIYVRVSTEAQADKPDNSLEIQERIVRSWVEDNGGTVYQVYADMESGTHDRRPGFQALIADAYAGMFQVAVVYEWDRWLRSVEVDANLRRVTRDTRVEFISCNQVFANDPSGNFFRTMQTGVAAFHAEQTSYKVKAKNVQLREIGRKTGGRMPFGYQYNEDKVLVEHPEQADILRAMFKVYLETGSLGQLINWLVERGIKSPTGKERWSKSSLQTLLSNPVYIGKHRRANGDIYEGNHVGLIDEETFEAAQHLTPSRRHSVSRARSRRPMFLLGLLRCKKCGNAMTTDFTKKNSGRRRYFDYYRCCSKFQKGWDACDSKLVSPDVIEPAVIAALGDVVAQPKALQRMMAQLNSETDERVGPLQEEITTLKARLATLDAELANLIAVLAVDGVGALDAVREAVANKEKERACLRRRLQDKEAQCRFYAEQRFDAEKVAAVMQDFGLIYEAATDSERIQLLRALIKKVEFDTSSNQGSIEFHYLPKLNLNGSSFRTFELRQTDLNRRPGG